MGYDLDLSPIKIRAMYRRFIIIGFTREEATNLVAKLLGLDCVKGGWKMDELCRVIFLRAIKERILL